MNNEINKWVHIEKNNANQEDAVPSLVAAKTHMFWRQPHRNCFCFSILGRLLYVPFNRCVHVIRNMHVRGLNSIVQVMNSLSLVPSMYSISCDMYRYVICLRRTYELKIWFGTGLDEMLPCGWIHPHAVLVGFGGAGSECLPTGTFSRCYTSASLIPSTAYWYLPFCFVVLQKRTIEVHAGSCSTIDTAANVCQACRHVPVKPASLQIDSGAFCTNFFAVPPTHIDIRKNYCNSGGLKQRRLRTCWGHATSATNMHRFQMCLCVYI